MKRLIDHIRAMDRAWARKVHGDRFTDAGEPDIDACIRGRAVKCEVKLPGGRPTPVQIGSMRRWEATGALVGWVTSQEQLDDLLIHLEDPSWVNPQLTR